MSMSDRIYYCPHDKTNVICKRCGNWFCDSCFKKHPLDCETLHVELNKNISDVCVNNIIESGLVKGVQQILEFGCKKYAPDSWKNQKKDFLQACYRHLKKHENGELFDQESMFLHIDHAICNLMFIRYFLKQNLKLNQGG